MLTGRMLQAQDCMEREQFTHAYVLLKRFGRCVDASRCFRVSAPLMMACGASAACAWMSLAATMRALCHSTAIPCTWPRGYVRARVGCRARADAGGAACGDGM